MKTDFFQSCDHCWVFQICWHIECFTLTASYLGIWNSLAEIPSPPLALFVQFSSVAQSCPTLCDPMDYRVHGILQARILECAAFSFSRGSSEPRSPALQASSLPAEPQGKPKNIGVGSPSLLQGLFSTQESNWGLLNCRQILYQLRYQGSPQALFVVMLPKVHFTSHSRMSGTRWIASWLSGSRPFLHSSFMHSCHLFLISSASVRSLPFLTFIMSVLAWNLRLISSIFLKWSLVFPILSFSSISLHFSFKKALSSLLSVVWNPAFNWIYLSLSPLPFASLLFSVTYKDSSNNHFAFLHFFFLGMFLVPASCTMLRTSVHHSSDT